jgi:putative membrane protein
MILEMILFLFAGILAGTISGLMPGLHINLIGVAIVSIATTTATSFPVYFVIFITAMAITHTFLDFIPSIFLGCPNEDTSLSALPGHELLKQGKGYEAVLLSTRGCFIGVFILILITPLLLFAVPPIYELIQKIIPYILILVVGVLIFTERKKLSATIVIILTGTLGYILLNLDLKEPLLPLLSGLFGSSSLLLSIKNKVKIPKQEFTETKPKYFKPILGSLIASPLCGFLPGLGSSQAAVLGNTIARTERKDFLFLLGLTNLLVMGFSFISIYAISKGRTGVAVAVQNILGTVELKYLILILITTLLVGIIAYFLSKKLTKLFANKINKIDYSKISVATLIILFILTLIISGFVGILILIISTITGIYCINTGTKRTNMMGCLLIPTIILYLF